MFCTTITRNVRLFSTSGPMRKSAADSAKEAAQSAAETAQSKHNLQCLQPMVLIG